uniref:Uncharacterized protein n=1 Tax=Solanum lycopersicum TaxID=4081 RepID=A0A3Q7EQV8_SOLLC
MGVNPTTPLLLIGLVFHFVLWKFMLNLELEDVTDKLKYLKIVSALSISSLRPPISICHDILQQSQGLVCPCEIEGFIVQLEKKIKPILNDYNI